MKKFFYSFIAILAFSSTYAMADNNLTESDATKIETVATPSAILSETVTEKEIAESASQNTQQMSTWEKIVSKMPKISGYLQTGYQYNSLGKHTSSFQAKRLRLIADAKVSKHVDFRLQIEAFNGISGSTNGNGQKNVQVMDAFATVKISDAFKIRTGQYYLPIGFENYNLSPSTLETVDFSDICYRMVCRNPFSYNFVDYGRDLGIMIFGDLFPSGKGFNYISYDLSLSNGSLPAKDDNNKSKDVIAALLVRPIKDLNLKGSFAWGQYAGTIGDRKYENQDMNRFVVGAWYNQPKGLDLRAEFAQMSSKDKDASIVKENTFYALAGYHIGNWLPVVRYSMYRDDVNKGTLNNYDALLFGFTYHFNNRFKIQANYIYSMYTDEAKAVNHDKGSSSKLQIMGMFKF